MTHRFLLLEAGPRPNAANFCSNRVRDPATFGLIRWSRTRFERKVSAMGSVPRVFLGKRRWVTDPVAVDADWSRTGKEQ